MDARIEQVIDSVEEFVADRDDALNIPRETAEFIHRLLLATGARRCLEIGTSYGYSGLWIGAALLENGGGLITLEKDARKSETAGRHFRDAGLAECVECRTGLAAEILAEIGGPVDFVFNDADKENCRRYVELLLPKLGPRAVVLTDNIISHADELGAFTAWIRGHEAFWSCGLPVGSGVELSVRKPNP